MRLSRRAFLLGIAGPILLPHVCTGKENANGGAATLEPLFTIVLAAVVLDERLRPIQWAGALLVVVSIVFAEIAARRTEMPAPV